MTRAVDDTADVEVVLTGGLERAVILEYRRPQRGKRVGQTKLFNEFVNTIPYDRSEKTAMDRG